MASPRVSYDKWNQELFKVILPPLKERGTPILLSCDNLIIERVGRNLGIPADEAVESFGREIQRKWRIAEPKTELKRIATASREFARTSQPRRPLPSFFGACMALILAASHMTSEGKISTGNYYDRLWALMGEQGTKPDFYYAEILVQTIAEWLEKDKRGSHGVVVMRSLNDGGPRNIAPLIQQSAFRERDREVLSQFFAEKFEHYDSNDSNHIARWLKRTPGYYRHLTKPAQQVLEDPRLQSWTDTTLHLARINWDGAVFDATGAGNVQKTWPGKLYLSRPNKKRNRPLQFFLDVEVSTRITDMEIGLAESLTAGSPVEIPGTVLGELIKKEKVFANGKEKGVRLKALADPIIFEADEKDQLEQVDKATQHFAHLLTKRKDLIEKFHDHSIRFGLTSLPDGWHYLESIYTDQLDKNLVKQEESLDKLVEIRGGLRLKSLNSSAYLFPHPPHLHTSSEAELEIKLNGDFYKPLSASSSVTLPSKPLGEMKIQVYSDEEEVYDHTIYIEKSTPAKLPYGSISFPVPTSPSASTIKQKLDICGAVLMENKPVIFPLLRRSQKQVHLIDAEGNIRMITPPQQLAWIQKLGLENPRWDVPITDRDVWFMTDQEATLLQKVKLETLTNKTRSYLISQQDCRARSSQQLNDVNADEYFSHLISLCEESSL